MQDYSGAGVTNNVLQITVTGDSDAEAVARAKALGRRVRRGPCEADTGGLERRGQSPARPT